jgi:hypothetical protein
VVLEQVVKWSNPWRWWYDGYTAHIMFPHIRLK